MFSPFSRNIHTKTHSNGDTSSTNNTNNTKPNNIRINTGHLRARLDHLVPILLVPIIRGLRGLPGPLGHPWKQIVINRIVERVIETHDTENHETHENNETMTNEVMSETITTTNDTFNTTP